MAITVCQCPVSTTIASIVTSVNDCKIELGQIQKLIFWRHGQSLAAAASAISSSVWTTRLAAVGDTKAVVSPFVSLIIPPTAKREVGSGNEVRDGIPIAIGTLPVKCEGHIWQTSQATIKLLKNLECEDLDVMFVNENGQLAYSLESGKVKGFPVTSFFVSDLGAGSYADGSKNQFSFYLSGGWSLNFTLTAATTFLLDAVNS
jgi:hypothetical protein